MCNLSTAFLFQGQSSISHCVDLLLKNNMRDKDAGTSYKPDGISLFLTLLLC